MPHVTNRGVRIGYRVHGDGEPLVLIHGWSCEGRYWDEFGYVDELGARFRLVIPDLRGHGESDSPTDSDFSDAAFASDIVAVLDDLGVDSAHVFGYSLGGWIVFELAVNSPDRVKKTVVGGAHPYAEDLSALRGFAPAEIVDTWKSLGAPLSQQSLKRLAEMDRQTLIDIAVDRIDQTERLRATRGPWLMICGTQDWRCEGMKRVAVANDCCEFVPIDGADHLQTWLSSERVIPPLREFLSSD